jgi:hypothetical protein
MIDTTQHPLAAAAAPSLVVLIGLGALLTGVDGVIAITTHQAPKFVGSTADYLVESVFAAGLVAGLAVPAELSRGSRGRLAAAGAWLAGAGQAAVALAVLATVLQGRDVLGGVYVAGTVAWLAGSLGLAAGAPRARVLALCTVPAVLIALGLFGAGGSLALSLLWTAVAVRARAA